jgi:hypothetical protein
LGEYKHRLCLLRVFRDHMTFAHTSKTYGSTIVILHNVLQYYSQFSDEVSCHIQSIRAPIEKDLKGYVRIASWKDVNVFAMKESAKKSHYQLHKFLKKYREALSTPVSDIIQRLRLNSCLSEKSSTKTQPCEVQIDSLFRVHPIESNMAQWKERQPGYFLKNKRISSVEQLIQRSFDLSLRYANGNVSKFFDDFF